MRSNGLTASSYLPVADLNPSVAEALLDELKEKRIAAYSQPVDSPSVSGLDRPEYRVEVLVRLYVDAAATDQALELVSAMGPYLAQRNDDLTWAQIVAGYDTPPATAVAPWPVYEDVDPAAPDDADETGERTLSTPAEGPAADEKLPYRSARWQGPARDTPEEDRFVPPPPPPLPRLSGAEQVAWLGLVGGPAVLLAAAVFAQSLPTWLTLLAALGFIGGFVTLVVRMDDGTGRLDDPDDGAQV